MGRDNENRGKKKKIVCWVVLFTLFFISTHSVCSADPDDRDIVIVFDASSSMEGLTNSGETKIDAAKEAVIEYLNGLTSDDRVALIVFYDCQDIQVEADFTYDRSLVSARVSSITAQGGTPIKDSLSTAWDYLKANGNINHSWYIVIFTDGGETCDDSYDPCQAAERIASESSSYRQTPVYTIGFMIEDGSQAEIDLRCIADTTGGKYFSADSPEELKEAFKKIDGGITMNEVIIYSVASTAVLGTLLVTRSLFYKHARGRGQRPRERTEYEEEDYFTEQPMKEEMTILWGATEEERDEEDYYPGEPTGGESSIIWEDEEQEEYTGEEFVDW